MIYLYIMYFGSLPEEYLLILVDDEEQRLAVSNNLLVQFSLIGAILLELAIQGRIAIKEDTIMIIDETPVEDNLIQDAFNHIIEEDNEKTIRYWLRYLSDEIDDVKERVVQKLQEEGKIKVEKTKKWFFFEETKYRVITKEMEDTIREDLKRIVEPMEESNHRAVGFLSLLYASGATGQIFSQDEIDEYMSMIRGIVDNEAIGQSITKSIRMITDALMRSQIINYGHFML